MNFYLRIFTILLCFIYESGYAKDIAFVNEEEKMMENQDIDLSSLSLLDLKNTKQMGTIFGYSFIYKDNINVHQSFDNKNEYTEKIRLVNSPFSYINEYDRKGRLIKKYRFFYNDYYGQVIQFNQSPPYQEVLLDYNKIVPFTPDMLIKKMKEEYQYDLLDMASVQTVIRTTVDNIPNHTSAIYILDFFIKGAPFEQGLDGFVIDGVTGKTLYRGTSSLPREETPSTMGKYLYKIIEENKKSKEL